MKTIRSFALSLLIFAFAPAAPVLSQPRDLPNFNRPSSCDVQHYVLRLKFDHSKRTVFATTTVRLKPIVDSLASFELDSNGLDYRSVTLESKNIPLKYNVRQNRIRIELDRAYSRNETIAVDFTYTAKPKRGIYFVDERRNGDTLLHSKQIWTQGEPDEAHHWFPSFDFPSDKATTETIITAEKGQSVIGNGELVSKTENADGTVTHHFKMPVPHPTYLVSFVVGEYVKVEDKYRDIPLGYYVYPGSQSIVPKAYGKTPALLGIFEELTRTPYPFNKYDQSMVANFSFGGMENISATTMADTEIFLANFDFLRGNVEDLVAHELAHSWFGNLVTCKNWAELWLNEGFATFMEAAVREKMYGRDEYLRKVGVDADSYMAYEATANNRIGLFNRQAGKVTALFDHPAVTYNKGGAVIHQLREQVGEDAFWRGIKLYLDRYRLGSVETTDLRTVMEEASWTDLGWFFDQWVYATGSPKLSIEPAYDPASKKLVLTVAQTHGRGSTVPDAFRLPLEVEVFTETGSEMKRIVLTKRDETLELPISAKPASLNIDPARKMPLMEVKLSPLK